MLFYTTVIIVTLCSSCLQWMYTTWTKYIWSQKQQPSRNDYPLIDKST
jgi:hypothetical protein